MIVFVPCRAFTASMTPKPGVPGVLTGVAARGTPQSFRWSPSVLPVPLVVPDAAHVPGSAAHNGSLKTVNWAETRAAVHATTLATGVPR